MKISAVQFDVKWGEPFVNQQFVEKYISENLIESDMVLLPEMFSTGFSMKPEKISEPMSDSPTLKWMINCAVKFRKVIAGSIAVSENGHYYNRFFFVKPSGEYEYADKRHLFRMSGEDEVYSKGMERKIVEYMGVRFLLLVCYDLRFPVWSRIRGNEYDVILYVASWPDVRIGVWDILLKARAMENLSYVVGVNRVGDDKKCHYNGHSVILDYHGRVVAAAADDLQEAITAVISVDELNSAREKFPAYLDSDDFIINR
ncbi:MAG: nitrilase-related carbon-nitrogen hydrolase [Rikenellaceae bacterium]